MSAGAMMVLIGGLIGAKLAPSQDLATLPVALLIVGTAIGVLPVTRLMGRIGRKPVFIFCAVFAGLSSAGAAFATSQQSFPLFLLATLCLGVCVSGFQQIRFAAMESVSPIDAPKAASTVLLGGLIAAMLGPQLADTGRDLVGTEYTGSFVLMALLCFICAFLFASTRPTCAHNAAPSETEDKQSISSVLMSPVFIAAVSASVIGYALMSFIMTATPVHMHVMEAHSLEHTKWVIQSHIIAMFFPSLFSGWLIARLGVSRVMMIGIFAYLCVVAVALLGEDLAHYWVALVLLGLGWNFLFLSGTVLLPRSHSPQQAFKVQSIHEFSVFTAQAIASLGAGFMLFQFGWRGLLLISLGIMVAHVGLLIWQKARVKRKPQQSLDQPIKQQETPL